MNIENMARVRKEKNRHEKIAFKNDKFKILDEIYIKGISSKMYRISIFRIFKKVKNFQLCRKIYDLVGTYQSYQWIMCLKNIFIYESLIMQLRMHTGNSTEKRVSLFV